MKNKTGFISNGFGYIVAIILIAVIAVLSEVNSNNILSTTPTSTTTTTSISPTSTTTTTKAKSKTTGTTKEDLSWCKKGEVFNVADKGISTKISGIEKLTVSGIKRNLCCSYGKLAVQGTADSSIDNFKACFNQDQYGVQYLYKSDTKTYRKISESYPKNGKTCIKLFDANGVAGQEMCIDLSKQGQ